jgi:hypothetical protein
MYVRWKKRVSSVEDNPTVWYAYLIENKRVDGKPRQKNIAYLASIAEGGEDGDWGLWFWCDAEEKLSRLELSSQELEAIRTQLATKVSRPTEEAIQQGYTTRPTIAEKRARGWPLHKDRVYGRRINAQGRYIKSTTYKVIK